MPDLIDLMRRSEPVAMPAGRASIIRAQALAVVKQSGGYGCTPDECAATPWADRPRRQTPFHRTAPGWRNQAQWGAPKEPIWLHRQGLGCDERRRRRA